MSNSKTIVKAIARKIWVHLNVVEHPQYVGMRIYFSEEESQRYRGGNDIQISVVDWPEGTIRNSNPD